MIDDDDIDPWEAFASDYKPIVPRRPSPKTVEEMADAIQALRQKYGALTSVPYEDCIVPTHMFFEDLCKRLLILENKETENE